MWYTFWLTNRCLSLNVDALGGLSVLVTTLTLSGLLSAGTAGLSITAMAFTPNIYWACRFWTGLELDLKSLIHKIAHSFRAHSRNPTTWNVSMSYVQMLTDRAYESQRTSRQASHTASCPASPGHGSPPRLQALLELRPRLKSNPRHQ
ncbi:hypothetical protein EI94DRAFT_726628 [Lactarius quietus]|nr:hypothetical protein EI94DRAFT_726628 [Lactarius quietus]